MKIYKKQVKKHEEVWADVQDNEYSDGGEGRVQICLGNANYGRLYVITNKEEATGMFLEKAETAEAFKLLEDIWEAKKNKNPFF